MEREQRNGTNPSGEIILVQGERVLVGLPGARLRVADLHSIGTLIWVTFGMMAGVVLAIYTVHQLFLLTNGHPPKNSNSLLHFKIMFFCLPLLFGWEIVSKPKNGRFQAGGTSATIRGKGFADRKSDVRWRIEERLLVLEFEEGEVRLGRAEVQNPKRKKDTLSFALPYRGFPKGVMVELSATGRDKTAMLDDLLSSLSHLRFAEADEVIRPWVQLRRRPATWGGKLVGFGFGAVAGAIFWLTELWERGMVEGWRSLPAGVAVGGVVGGLFVVLYFLTQEWLDEYRAGKLEKVRTTIDRSRTVRSSRR